MQSTTFTFTSSDHAAAVFTRRWSPDGPAAGTVQIAHGMGEHSARYARLAEALTGRGWVVYANDLRGHGHTAVGEDGDGDAAGLGVLGPSGWSGLIDDIVQLNRIVGTERPGLPRILLGHSMGSFAAQQFVFDHSREIDGLVLSGTTAVDLAASTMDTESESDLTILNAAFEPARTPFDWLSRDEAEVDAYVADPWCGFGLDLPSTRSLVDAAARFAEPEALAGVRADLPVYLVAGSDDPLNLSLALLDLVAQRYRDAGVTDITTDYHEGARHEVFNETNRAEVTTHLLDWLDRFIG